MIQADHLYINTYCQYSLRLILKENIRVIQRLTGLKGNDVDGIAGVITITKLEHYLSPELPTIPAGASLIVSKKSLDFIVKSEIVSKAYYEKHLTKPTWPKGESGITIGIGYDLGYNSVTDIHNDWQPFVSITQLEKLKSVSGLKGMSALEKLSLLSSITIDLESASEVFYKISLPKYAKKVLTAYPTADQLQPDAQGALLSLVYNRGNSLKGKDRQEMANIVSLVDRKDLAGMAREIRAMKKIWEGKNHAGLIRRREKEALFIENATYFIMQEDCVII